MSEITPNETNTSKVIPIDLKEEMQKSFISYAMAVIINRALPDVRDGLKPVHRRILYSMNELGLTPDKPHKKCARIVGDVLGKYHPHGDTAIYDSLVRMAQDFSTRYLLVDGHGNFGSVDGDSAAAMRYTEARMGRITTELLRDIDKNTVDFYPNFDESLMQPTTLPCRYPNLLVNGTGGIAVGMTTNIPPHNLGETIDAAVMLIDNPDATIFDLMKVLPGPDFPTGGLIVGTSGIREAYKTGRGRIKVRARAEIEQEKDGKEAIIISEIPYQVNKEELVKTINTMVHEKRLEGVTECRDESDHSGMRVVINLKKGVSGNVVLNRLYKHTQMQTTFGVIMLALVDGQPRILDIKQALAEYLKYQEEVIERRTRYDLEKAEKRAHILEGLLRALDFIDEIINTIRSSPDPTTARTALCEKFDFSEVQAQAILDMRLQRLTGLEREKLETEYEALMERIKRYRELLADPHLILLEVKKDLLEIKDKYGDDRRTSISVDEEEIDSDELVQEEDMMVTLTHFGYVKRISPAAYKAQHRGGRGITGLTTREDDFAQHVLVTSTHSHIFFFTDKGKVYTKKCYQLPEAGRQAKGTAIVNLLSLDAGEKITAMIPSSELTKEGYLFFATKNGTIKRTSLAEFANLRQHGLKAIELREDDKLVSVFKTTGSADIMLGTRKGQAIRFRETDVRPMGRAAMGCRGIALREGDEVIAAFPVMSEYILSITEQGYGKRMKADEFRLQNRGGYGLRAAAITDRSGHVAGLECVREGEDLMLVSDENVVIRMKADEISIYGRNAQGVRVMRIGEGAKVVCMARLDGEAEEDEIAGEE